MKLPKKGNTQVKYKYLSKCSYLVQAVKATVHFYTHILHRWRQQTHPLKLGGLFKPFRSLFCFVLNLKTLMYELQTFAATFRREVYEVCCWSRIVFVQDVSVEEMTEFAPRPSGCCVFETLSTFNRFHLIIFNYILAQMHVD